MRTGSTTSAAKLSVGTAALAKLGAVLEKLAEFTKAHYNVVLKDGDSEAHASFVSFGYS